MTHFDRAGFKRELGLRLMLCRKARRMTQQTLADRIGITRSQIANVEAGRSGMHVDVLWRAAIVLDVKASKLLPERAP
jgi:transcriptional regulator with XRE-family HTH domain